MPQVRPLIRAGRVWENEGMPSSVQLIRASNLSDVAEYA
jgi:hypothetical protein